MAQVWFFSVFLFLCISFQNIKKSVNSKNISEHQFLFDMDTVASYFPILNLPKTKLFWKKWGGGEAEGEGEGEGAVPFVLKEFRYLICFDYPRSLSHASIISTAEIKRPRYFFHALIVKGEVLSRKFCIVIVIIQINVGSVLYFFMWILIDYFDIFEFKYIIDHQAD